MPKLIYINFAWGQEYVFYWLAVLALIVSSSGFLIWIKRRFHRPDFNQVFEETMNEISGNSVPTDNRITRMQQQLTELKDLVRMLDNRLIKLTEHTEKQKDTMPINSHHFIYQAFDSGQSIPEIARTLNKDLGEIELILNLRKHLS